jgi:hypothetical protein
MTVVGDGMITLESSTAWSGHETVDRAPADSDATVGGAKACQGNFPPCGFLPDT